MLLPRPLPWLKFGFSNAVILIFMPVLSWRKLATIQIGKAFFSHLFLGLLISPTFLFALVGGLVSVSVMVLAYRIGRFSFVAISILGALAHTFSQLLIVYILFSQSRLVIQLFLPLGLLACVFGAITGFLATAVLRRGILERLPETFADSL